MTDFTKEAKQYLENFINNLKKSKSSPDINPDEVADDIYNDILEKINEKNPAIVTKSDIERIINEMGLNESIAQEKPEKKSESAKDRKRDYWHNEKIRILKFNLSRTACIAYSLLISAVLFAAFCIINVIIIALYQTLTDGYAYSPFGPYNTISYEILFYLLNFIFSLFYFSVIAYIAVKTFNLKYRTVIIISLAIISVSFLIEGILSFEIFKPFPVITIICLAVIFSVLLLTVFYKKIHPLILTLIMPVLAFGFFFCMPFMVYIFPFAIFSWAGMIIPGLNLLPISPMIASACFIYAIITVSRHLIKRKALFILSSSLITLTLVLVISYSSWTAVNVRKTESIIKYYSEEHIGHDRIYKDMVKWANIAMNLPVDRSSKLLLTSSEQTFFFSYESAEKFDPVTFLPLQITRSYDYYLKSEESAKIRQILLKKKSADSDRLWSGDDIETKIIDSHIQIYPEARIAYNEITLTIIKNKNEWEEDQEAIYTIQLPPDCAASKLTLRIEGVEQNAKMSLKSKSKKAYDDIVGVEKRDPSLLEWIDADSLRLKVFPVRYNLPRTVKIGLIMPLEKNGGKLIFTPAKIEGHTDKNAKYNLYIDVMTHNEKINIQGNDIKLNEKTISDNQIRQFFYTGKYNKKWTLSADSVNLKSSFVIDNELYQAGDIKYMTKEYNPDAIYILLSNVYSKKDWIALIGRIYKVKSSKTKVYLITDEIFYSDDEGKCYAYINETKLPNFHLFPLYILDKDKKSLIITANDKYSINFQELKGSVFYKNSQEFIAQNRNEIYAATLSPGLPEYYAGLKQFNIIKHAAHDMEGITEILTKKQINLIDDKDAYIFEKSDFAIYKTKTNNPGSKTEGNDLLFRLASYKYIMNELGKRYFINDSDQSDLLKYANDAKVVTPVSSFIVLETQKDYDKTDIKEDKSKLNQTQKKKNTGLATDLGIVPEPEEWAIMILIVIALLFIFRKKLLSLIGKKA